MKIYQDYLQTRQLREGFLTWLLIRKMKFRHQCVVIFILIASWLIAAPYLVFWVNFFKGSLVLSLLLLIGYGVKYILSNIKRRQYDRY